MRLLSNKKYIEGVIAQAFYVGVQIMCWTFIIQYAENELGMSKTNGQMFNMVAMVIFVSSRFICTFLLKFFSPGGLLLSLSIGGLLLILGTIFIPAVLKRGPSSSSILTSIARQRVWLLSWLAMLRVSIMESFMSRGLAACFRWLGFRPVYVADVSQRFTALPSRGLVMPSWEQRRPDYGHRRRLSDAPHAGMDYGPERSEYRLYGFVQYTGLLCAAADLFCGDCHLWV